MKRTLIFIMICCVAFAFVGALGEKKMRYGIKKGILKKNNEEDDRMKSDKITVIIKPVGASAYFTEIENTLEVLQRTVGGYIETVTLASDMVIVCNEEGRTDGSRYNTRLLGEPFFGNIIICGVKDEDLASLPIDEKTARQLFCRLFTERDGNA